MDGYVQYGLPSPHYARATGCDRGSGRPSLQAAGFVRRNDVGAASSRDERGEAGRSALRRRIVALLIVKSETRPAGGVVVESLGVTPVIQGRERLRMRFAPQIIPAPGAPFFARSRYGASCIMRARPTSGGSSLAGCPTTAILSSLSPLGERVGVRVRGRRERS